MSFWCVPSFAEDWANFPHADWISYRFPAVERVVAVGDMHADPYSLATILHKMDLVDEYGVWIGGKTVLVLMGDILDRGLDSRLCLSLLYSLARQGATVHLLLGNHEILVVEGITIYTAPEDSSRYLDFGPRGIVDAMANPHSLFANELGFRNTFLQIGSSVFVHAGPGEEILTHTPDPYQIAQVNTVFRLMIATQQKKIPFEGAWTEEAKWLRYDPLSSPLFSKTLALDAVDPKRLDRFHASLGVHRTVIGHKRTESGRIEPALDGRVLKIDTGNSSFFWNVPRSVHNMSALEILNDEKVLAHRIRPNPIGPIIAERVRAALGCGAPIAAAGAYVEAQRLVPATQWPMLSK